MRHGPACSEPAPAPPATATPVRGAQERLRASPTCLRARAGPSPASAGWPCLLRAPCCSSSRPIYLCAVYIYLFWQEGGGAAGRSAGTGALATKPPWWSCLPPTPGRPPRAVLRPTCSVGTLLLLILLVVPGAGEAFLRLGPGHPALAPASLQRGTENTRGAGERGTACGGGGPKRPGGAPGLRGGPGPAALPEIPRCEVPARGAEARRPPHARAGEREFCLLGGARGCSLLCLRAEPGPSRSIALIAPVNDAHVR